jgi:hypothetical protein
MTRIPIRPPSAKNVPSSSASGMDEPQDVGPLSLNARDEAALRALGLTNPGTVPDHQTPLADLLLYALTPHGGARPDHGIVLGVAAELDTMAMFIEGPLGVTLEMMARRIRAAVDIARRMSSAEVPPPPPSGAA